ncbi:MAG: sigma-70 family RNA polymerase sigma factor [Planctomycetota bacterium]
MLPCPGAPGPRRHGPIERPAGAAILQLFACADFERACRRVLAALGDRALPRDCFAVADAEDASLDRDALCAKLLELLERRVRDAISDESRERFRRDLFELRERVLVAQQAWVRTIAREYRRYSLPLCDLTQEASIALMRAIEKYDWRRNVKFRTYAEYWIRQAIERELARSRSLVRIPLYVQQKARRLRRRGVLEEMSMLGAASALGLPASAVQPVLRFGNALVSIDEEAASGSRLADTLASGAGVDGPGCEENAALAQRLAEALRRLPAREGEALRRRFGLLGTERETLAQIGARLGVTPERVRQIVTRALLRLRQGPAASALSAFLD